MNRLSRRWRLIFYRIMVQPLPESPAPGIRGSKRYEFTALDAPAPVLTALGRPEGVIRQRFASGCRCVVATRDGVFAGCLWYQVGAYEEDEVRSRFILDSPLMAWDFDVFVVDGERLGFLFLRLWQHAAQVMRADGLRCTASRISGFNASSLNSHRRLGAVEIQKLVYLVFGSVQIALSNRAPYVNVSRAEKDRPRYRMVPPANFV